MQTMDRTLHSGYSTWCYSKAALVPIASVACNDGCLPGASAATGKVGPMLYVPWNQEINDAIGLQSTEARGHISGHMQVACRPTSPSTTCMQAHLGSRFGHMPRSVRHCKEARKVNLAGLRYQEGKFASETVAALAHGESYKIAFLKKGG